MKHTFLRLDTTELLISLCTDLDIHSDTVDYLLRRLRNEGVSFLTVTLPKLNALLLEALEGNSLKSLITKYTCFQWKSGAPLHFKRLTDRIFDRNGSVLVDACEVAIYQIRQLSLYFYKLALSYTETQLAQAEVSFLQVEEELANETFDINFVDSVRKNIETNYQFPKYETVLSSHRPRNGPGTFADSKRTNKNPWHLKKYSAEVYNTVKQGYEAISGFFKPYPASKDKIVFVKQDTADYSEVLFVPKDSRGPRVIMREPLYALQLQMSFFDWFSKYLQRSTNGRINFTDQTVNRRLAEHGSIDGSWATIDLKEASDRVSYAVVKQLARNIPVLHWFLKKSRTCKAKLPSSKMINLKKLAGMGSGLTFTWLSFLIHSAVATEISITTGMPFKQASSYVYTYGDDLIVPVCYVQEAESALKKVSLVVNTKKSYSRRHYKLTRCFRESCGGDYYGGADVSVARLKLQNCSLQVAKRIIKVSGSQAIVMVSAHAGEVSLQGLNSLSRYLYWQLEKCTGRLPLMGRRSSVIGQLTRKYVAYPTDKNGTYVPLQVLCSIPVLLESPGQHPVYKIAQALANQGFDRLGFLDGNNTASEQFVSVLPRTVKYKYQRISSLSLMR